MRTDHYSCPIGIVTRNTGNRSDKIIIRLITCQLQTPVVCLLIYSPCTPMVIPTELLCLDPFHHVGIGFPAILYLLTNLLNFITTECFVFYCFRLSYGTRTKQKLLSVRQLLTFSFRTDEMKIYSQSSIRIFQTQGNIVEVTRKINGPYAKRNIYIVQLNCMN